MKEFFVTLKQTEKVTRMDHFCCLVAILLGACVGIFMSLSILYAGGVRNHLGAVTILNVATIIIGSGGLLIFPTHFQQALSMGKVRKYLFAGNYLLWLRNTLEVLLIAWGVYVVEEVAYSRLVGESVKLPDMEFVLGNPLVFMTILFCAPVLILFLGAMILRFGVHILWGCLGLCLLTVGLGRLEGHCSEWALMKWLGVGSEPNVAGICLLCLVCGALMLGLAWLVFRKQRVIF